MNKENIINWDFQGWPMEKKTLREILMGIGLKLKDGMWQIEDTNPLLDIYPTRLIDDGMGYGIDEQWFIDVHSSLNDGKPNCVFFTEPQVRNIELWREGKFHPYNQVKLVKDGTKLYVTNIRKNKNEFEYECCTDFLERKEQKIWHKENELEF